MKKCFFNSRETLFSVITSLCELNEIYQKNKTLNTPNISVTF